MAVMVLCTSRIMMFNYKSKWCLLFVVLLRMVLMSFSHPHDDEAPIVKKKTIVQEGYLSFEDSPLIIHYGVDFNSQALTPTSSIVNFGLAASQKMWVSNNGKIMVIDLSQDNYLSANVSGLVTECSETHSLFVDTTVMLFHENTFKCSCGWSEAAPCPALLRANRMLSENSNDDPQSNTEYIIAGNTAVPVLSVNPPVSASAVVASSEINVNATVSSQPEEACAPLANAVEMAGNFCVTLRGSCLYQTKYDNCKAAGAVGAVVINRNDVFSDMPGQSIIFTVMSCPIQE